MLGQVIRRSEKDNQAQAGDPHEIWHRMSGRQMGYVGNNGNYDVTYFTSRHQRQTAGGPGTGSFADFDLAHDHINSYEQGARGGVYTAHAGDTLSGIAANLWGDASLWYKIAEVNGLTAESVLIEGQPLLIPTGVQRNENNAQTFQPYDPLEVLGNTSPTSPKPKQGGCGMMGQIILVVIAVVVSIFTAGAALAAMGAVSGGIMGGVSAVMGVAGVAGATVTGVAGLGVAGTMAVAGAIGGAAGSIVSQGVGVATGIQDKFSWNAVALAAIGGGVGAGLGSVAAEGAGWAGRLLQNNFVRGAVGSAITQGVGVAIGAQDKFSWAGVAGAGVGATVAGQIGGGDGFGAKFARNTASAVANAATRSLMNGGDFGDNLMAALPDVVGQSLGEAIAGGFSRRSSATPGSAEVGSTPGDAAEVAAQTGAQVETLSDGARVVRNVFQLNQEGEGFLRSSYYDEAGVLHEHSNGEGIRFVSDSGPMAAGDRYIFETRIPASSREARVSRLINESGETFEVYDGGRIEEIGMTVSVGRFEASAAQRGEGRAGLEAHRAAERAAVTAAYNAAYGGPVYDGPARKVTWGEIGNAYWQGILDTPDAIGRGVDNFFNGSLSSQSAIDHFATMPYRDAGPLPTLLDGYRYGLNYVPFVGPAINAFEQHQAVVTALSYGDEASAVRHAQGAIVNTAAAVLSAPAAFSVARGVAGEVAVHAPRVRVEFQPRGMQTYAVIGPLPVRARLLPPPSSNARFVESLAMRADAAVAGRVGTPSQVGTWKHTYARDLLLRYNRRYGNPRGLEAEVRYWNGAPWNPGDPLLDSVKLDVVDITGASRARPAAVYDYKFGLRKVGAARVAEIRAVGGFGNNVSIYEVRP